MAAEIRRDVYQAIADPNRRQMIDMLSRGQMTLNAIAEKLEISRPAVSQHIKILCECGILEIEQAGRERQYKIQTQALVPAFLWLEQYQRQWAERIDAFENYVNKRKKKK